MTTAMSGRSADRHRLVVGCGYLGERVARRWRAAGSRVIAVTRRPDRAAAFAAAGFEPLLADVTDPAADWSAVANLDELATVFWAVGFDRGGGGTHHDVHVTGLRRLLDSLPAGCRVIFSSSTGVWGDEGGRRVDELTPPSPTREAGRVLVEAETVLRGHPRGPGVALRFAGLYGPGRLPRIADVEAGRPIDANPDAWLNMIHVDDAARIVCGVAELAAPRPLYVVSDGRPVLRRDWYGQLAKAVGGPPPRFLPNDLTAAASRSRAADKRVDPSAILTDLEPLLGDAVLEHPDPLAAITAARGSGTP
jgi:nucleoside-diphosphate-sugar epimerase